MNCQFGGRKVVVKVSVVSIWYANASESLECCDTGTLNFLTEIVYIELPSGYSAISLSGSEVADL